MRAGDGSSWCAHCIPARQGFDLCLCLQGPYGGVFGACCDDATATCANNIEINSCTGDSQRFVANAACNQLNPPCGVILGACCYANATCAISLQSDCASTGGNWLGPHSICSSCPCLVPCTAGAIAEGEPVCSDGYNDQFNGGCIVSSPAFSPIQINQTVCGRSGVFLINGVVHGDFDWYQVQVTHATTLRWTARGELRIRMWIYNGTNGCPGV